MSLKKNTKSQNNDGGNILTERPVHGKENRIKSCSIKIRIFFFVYWAFHLKVIITKIINGFFQFFFRLGFYLFFTFFVYFYFVLILKFDFQLNLFSFYLITMYNVFRYVHRKNNEIESIFL